MATYLRWSIADSLEAINSPLSSKDTVIYALAGLPEEYESFIRTVTNNNSSFTFDELRVLYQEQRLQHLHGAYDSSSQVASVAASYNVYYYIMQLCIMRELGQSAVLDLKSSNASTNMEISLGPLGKSLLSTKQRSSSKNHILFILIFAGLSRLGFFKFS